MRGSGSGPKDASGAAGHAARHSAAVHTIARARRAAFMASRSGSKRAQAHTHKSARIVHADDGCGTWKNDPGIASIASTSASSTCAPSESGTTRSSKAALGKITLTHDFR